MKKEALDGVTTDVSRQARQPSQKELSRVEVLERLKAKKMHQKKGAEALGLSVRRIRRLQKKYAQKGAAD